MSDKPQWFKDGIAKIHTRARIRLEGIGATDIVLTDDHFGASCNPRFADRMDEIFEDAQESYRALERRLEEEGEDERP